MKYDGIFRNGNLIKGKEYDSEGKKVIYSGDFFDGRPKETVELFIQRNDLIEKKGVMNLKQLGDIYYIQVRGID